MLQIELSAEEVVFLTDSLTSEVEEQHNDEGHHLFVRELYLLLASVYNELVEETGFSDRVCTIVISERQLWELLCRVRTGDLAINDKAIGIALKRKLHDALLVEESGMADLAEDPEHDLTIEEAILKATGKEKKVAKRRPKKKPSQSSDS